MPNKKGVIYFVNGLGSHIAECLYSLKTLRKYHPNLSVTLFSTVALDKQYERQFNKVIRVNEHSSPFKLKVKSMLNSPYQKTLYLDADTEIRGPFHEIWEFLETFEMAIARENHCNWDWSDFKFFDFRGPHFNTGVIAYRKTSPVEQLLKDWVTSMENVDDKMLNQVYGDQNFFNDLLEQHYSSFLPCILELPNKIYNVRTWGYNQLEKDEQEQLVKIFHAHGLHIGFLEKMQNRLRLLKK